MLTSVAFKVVDIVAKDRERWALWVPVGIALGIGWYFSLQTEPPLWLGAVLVLVCVSVYVSLSRIALVGRFKSIRALVVIPAVCAIGFTSAQLRTQQVSAPVLEKPVNFAIVHGRIKQLEHYPSGVRVTLENLQISKIEPYHFPKYVRIRLRGSQPVFEPGDWISGRASLSPAGAPAIPGGFDFQRHSFFQEIGAYGYSTGQFQITAKSEEAGGLSASRWIARIRDQITQRILAGLPEPQNGIAAALMTGEKRAVAEQIVEDLRDSGLAHLLAISGLHIGLIAGLVFSGFRFLMVIIPGVALRYPVKKWAACAAISAAFIYALLAGATLPTQRAFIMAAIALLAVIIDRRGISLRSVAWAATIVLLLQPESLLGPSFQMSFAAVTALVACYEFWTARRRSRMHQNNQYVAASPLRSIFGYLGGVSMTTLVASAATTPFALYHFNQFADYSLFANLVAVPVTALWVMPWAVISFLAMPLGFEQWALVPMGWGITAVVYIADTVASWPGSVTRLAAIPTWGISVLALASVWLFIWRHRWRLFAIPCMAIGFASFSLTENIDLIIDGDARLFAALAPNGKLYVSNLRKAKRDQELWLRHLGLYQAVLLQKSGSKGALQSMIKCDSLGCIFSKQGIRVAIAHSEGALNEDCWDADVVVSLVPIRSSCSALHQIDRFDLWKNGTYAISVTEKGVTITNANEGRGDRPWVIKKKPSSGQVADTPKS